MTQPMLYKEELKAPMCCEEGQMTASKCPGELKGQPCHPKTL